jgi:hypothetical protein
MQRADRHVTPAGLALALGGGSGTRHSRACVAGRRLRAIEVRRWRSCTGRASSWSAPRVESRERERQERGGDGVDAGRAEGG